MIKKTFSVPLFFTFFILLIAEVIIFFSFRKPTITLYPNSFVTAETYSDETHDTGTSSIEMVEEDQKLKVSYYLTTKHKWPFAGLRLEPESPINLMGYDYLVIDASVEKEQKEIVAFWTAPFEIGSDSSGEQPHHYGITFIPKQKTYTIPLNMFITPPWWLELHNLEQNDIPTDIMKKVTGVGIRTGFASITNENRSYVLERAVLYKKNSSVYIVMVLVFLGTFLILFLMEKLKSTTKRVVVPLKELDITTPESSLLERVIAVIGENCDNPDLSLYSVAELSQVSEPEVSKTIKDEFGLNFKQYLNQVRMEIATTLLAESDLSIKEITFKSGYKTNSHFFRVFRSFYNESPAEYRKRVSKKR